MCWPDRRANHHCIDRDNFFTHQAGQSHKQGKKPGEQRELQADGGQQGLETQPHKQKSARLTSLVCLVSSVSEYPRCKRW